MERRSFIKQTAGLILASRLELQSISVAGPQKPVFVYNNWWAYDELSDKVVHTEALAMTEQVSKKCILTKPLLLRRKEKRILSPSGLYRNIRQ